MSYPLMLVLAAQIVLLAGMVLCGLLSSKDARRVTAAFGGAAAALGLLAAALAISGRYPGVLGLWRLPILGQLRLSLDPVDGLFMLPLAISFLGAFWSSGDYLRRYEGQFDTRTLGVLFLALFGACLLILTADDVVSFLIAWRLMSGLATFPIILEHRHDENRRAAWLFLAMNEAGIIAVTVALFWMVALSGNHIGFNGLANGLKFVDAPLHWVLFLILFFGFSVKAGLVPMSSWLPTAHPVAPASISAILSGALLNFGIYGILRFDAIIFPAQMVGPGLVVMMVGAVSALIGILYASIEDDIKRMLAHSSIENMGIIAANIGMAMVFASTGLPVLAAIAYVVAIYHMFNHSSYKTLLFIGAGAIDQHAGTRDLNLLGGLLRRMPVLAALFLIGVLAISAIPPLNGFVTEWLTLQNILRSEQLASRASRVIFALCGTGLALTAALAVTCFAKVYAMGFLGMPRSVGAAEAHESGKSTRFAMVWLAIVCIALGLGPTLLIPMIDRAADGLTHRLATTALVPPFFTSPHGARGFSAGFMHDFHNIGAGVGRHIIPARGLVVLHQGGKSNPVVYAMSTFYLAIMLMGIILVTWILIRGLSRRNIRMAEPWAGGLRRLSSDMTYTATGFSNPVRVIFKSIFGHEQRENSRTAVEGHFRTAIQRTLDADYIVDRLVLKPIAKAARFAACLLAKIHALGVVNAYAAWLFLVLLALLLINRLW
ncbi:MAG: proton-conducting transporter membrane subunit [Phycisphaerae bacterium]